MKKILTITLCILLALTFTAGCVSINFTPVFGSGLTGTGSLETYTFNVGEITHVRVELLCNIVYNSAPSDTVTLKIQPNLMEHVTVEEINGILTVRATRNINITGTGNTPVLTVSTPSLTRVSHTGAGNFTTIDPITTDSFTLDITGAANGKAMLNVNDLTVNISGAGDLTLTGTAETNNISMTGAGRLEALDLETRTTTINMAGAGSVKINATEELNITAGGVGTIEYKGSPSIDITRGGIVTVKQIS